MMLISAAGAVESGYIADIEFTGLKHLTASVLKNVMVSKKKGLFFRRGSVYDKVAVEGDLERIKELYHAAGYYDVVLTEHLSRSRFSDGVVLTIEVDEGEPIRVENISVESPIWPAGVIETLGITKPTVDTVMSGEVFPDLPLQSGDIFTTAGFNNIKKTLFQAFASHGFAQAEVKGQVNLYKKEHQADVYYTIIPGEQFYIAGIAITGNEKTAPYLIERELSIQQDELYSLTKILEDEKNLLNLDLFTTASVKPQWGKRLENRLPLEVTVVEKPPRGIKIGLGYGNEEKGRVSGEIRWRNFLNRGYLLKFTGKYSAIGRTLEAQFNDPYFMGNPDIDFLYRLGYEFEDLESFTNTKYFSKFQFSKEFTRDIDLFIAHNIESNETRRLPTTVAEIAVQRYGRIEDRNFLVSSAEIGGKWDTADNRIYPSSGFILDYSMETASKFIGSDIDFIRQVLEFKGYRKSFKDIILALRLKAGTVDPTKGGDYIPISKRFFAGGSNSVRGYPYQELGDEDSLGNPIGGYSLFEGSMETRFPLYNELHGVVFFDTGNVFATSYDFNMGDLRHSVGVGLRYNTIVGPIRLDVGYQLNPENPKDTRFRVHISLGEAF